MPRCEPIAERYYNDPKKWSLSNYDDDDCFGGDFNEFPPMGYIRFEYKIAEALDYRLGNLFQLWYEMLRKDEKTFWHLSRAKAEQKVEYRWDDFIADKQAGNIPAEEDYDPVVRFDQRFHYYDSFKDTVGNLPEASTRDQEEAKSTLWEIEGLELELCMAMDPESYAAKAINPKKRKPDPETEGEGISSHPAAKRKPEGVTETPKASTSDSPSASHDPHPVDTETPSETRSASAIGAIEPPRVRPSHTPASTIGTDAERQDEAVAEATIMETDLDNASLDVLTPEEQLVTGDAAKDIQTLIYHANPRLVSVRHLIDPVVRSFMSQLRPGDSTEEEDRRLQEFLPNCFEDTLEELINSVEPIDDDIQNSFGNAVEAFPRIMPTAFSTMRKIMKRMAARHRAANPPMDEEEEEAQYTGYNVPEFTQLLMNVLEEITPHEPWDPALRTSLCDQLTHFLYNNTSTESEYLVGQYQGYLIQLVQAQTKRLKDKYGLDKLAMLKESGSMKRIINQIPEAARVTFERYRYNPDKKQRQDPVFAEASMKRYGMRGQGPQLPRTSRNPQKLRFRISQEMLTMTFKMMNSKGRWNDPNKRCSITQRKLQIRVDQRHPRDHPWFQHLKINHSQRMNRP